MKNDIIFVDRYIINIYLYQSFHVSLEQTTSSESVTRIMFIQVCPKQIDIDSSANFQIALLKFPKIFDDSIGIRSEPLPWS